MDERTADENDRGEIVGTKKRYLRPELVRLGTLTDLTRTVGYKGQADGGRFPQRFRTGTF